MEVEIDRDLSQHHRAAPADRARPAPADRRVSKTIANLERVGDEAARIARTVQRLINTGVSSRLRLPVGDLSLRGRAGDRLSCARRSTPSRGSTSAKALEVLKHDDQIDQEFEA